MLSMIQEAKSSIMIVGYVVFNGIEPIFNALSKAADNGVTVDFLFDKALKHKKLINSMWKSKRKPNIYSYKPKQKRSSLHAKVLIIDDLLATGGTANATGSIIEKLKGEIISYAFLIILSDLKGKAVLKPYSVYNIIEY